ncbi:MAG: DUF962 domain-containing protein [Polyangiales bacterium]
MTERAQSFEEFWPYYVGAHRTRGCRALHYVGTSLGLACLVAALGTGQLWLLLAFPIFGYGFAWVGHYGVEKNRPATFDYWWWSLRGDFKMLAYGLTGRMANEVTRLYGSPTPAADAPRLAVR